MAPPRPIAETPSGSALARAADAFSDSGTKFSAYAHDAARGADLAEDLAGAVTGVSLAKRVRREPSE